MRFNKTYLLLWLSQFVSLLGTHVSGFALGLYMYQQTNSVILYSLLSFMTVLPEIALSPVVGVMIDRWNRKWAMIMGHAGAGIGSLIIVSLLYVDQMEVYYILPLIMLSSVFNAFIFPAFTAASSQVLTKDQLNRSGGMVQLGWGVVMIGSPAVAGFLLLHSGLKAVFLLDVLTFCFAIIVLLLIRIESEKRSPPKKSNQKLLVFQEIKESFDFIKNHRNLMTTLVLFSVININLGMLDVLVSPLVLSIADTSMVGLVLSIGGIGMLIGSVLLIIFDKVKRHENKIKCFYLLQGIILVIAFWKISAIIIAIATFVFMMFGGIAGGLDQAMWQITVPSDKQGRVFSLRLMIGNTCLLLGFVLSGPLSEFIKYLISKDIAGIKWLAAFAKNSQKPEIIVLFFMVGVLTIVLVISLHFYFGQDNKDRKMSLTPKITTK